MAVSNERSIETVPGFPDAKIFPLDFKVPVTIRNLEMGDLAKNLKNIHGFNDTQTANSLRDLAKRYTSDCRYFVDLVYCNADTDFERNNYLADRSKGDGFSKSQVIVVDGLNTIIGTRRTDGYRELFDLAVASRGRKIAVVYGRSVISDNKWQIAGDKLMEVEPLLGELAQYPEEPYEAIVLYVLNSDRRKLQPVRRSPIYYTSGPFNPKSMARKITRPLP